MNRARILLTLFGFLLGVGAGLVYSWALNPVEYTDTAPASLRQDFKEDYLSLIASAFMATGDLNRARARLTLLGVSASSEELSRLAQSRLAAGQTESEAQALAQLAAALGERPAPAMQSPSPTAERGTNPTATPSPSPTIRPTLAPSPTPGAPYSLLEREPVCDPNLPAALIQVIIQDAAGDGVPGEEILVIWDNGQDRFFTGLKPELGAGYADFTMQPATIYSLQLADGEAPVSGIQAEACFDESGDSYPGSWLLVFQQPAVP